ncbi:IS5 family transposase [Actinomyces sp. Z5]|uniref:IS5 family transposase n=1 Tax=Actinomyces sp. Z5 TaxID=2250216 RepID=UPI000DCF5C2A|nr:IS5 family transposase [Actinomyces sp. Z5]RAX20863.1 IS5 family transposase [Actinomyces sp. Z5]
MDACARHDLTDAQWELLAPLLPAPPARGRPRVYPLRDMINAVRWRTRVSAPWRDVPARYGPWWRAYALYRAWQLAGVWERIEAALVARADAAGRVDWRVSVDSTTCRAHVHAAGARKDSPQLVDGEPEDHALGTSRGGWSTKVHAAADAACGMLARLLTAGQAADAPLMIPVLEEIHVQRPAGGRPRTRPQVVLADKAYSSRANRDWLRAHHIRATIPIKADQAAHRKARGRLGGRPPAFDPIAYKDRNAVERCFGCLKQHRGFATRYDKLAVRYQATIHIASIDHWLKRLT